VAGQKIALIVGAGFSTETGLPTTAQLGQLFLKNPPASTAVQVPRLFRPEFLVEVEAVAVIQ